MRGARDAWVAGGRLGGSDPALDALQFDRHRQRPGFSSRLMPKGSAQPGEGASLRALYFPNVDLPMSQGSGRLGVPSTRFLLPDLAYLVTLPLGAGRWARGSVDILEERAESHTTRPLGH